MMVAHAHIEAVCPRCKEPIRVDVYREDEEHPWRVYWVDLGKRFETNHDHQPTDGAGRAENASQNVQVR